MNNRQLRLLSLVLAAGLLLPGCALLSKLLGAFEKPKLTFKTASLRQADLSGATLDLVYTLENPNPFGLSLKSISYQLEIEGRHVVSGTPPKGLKIKSRGASQLTFPATVKFADLAPTLMTFLQKDSATFRASGHIGIDTPVGVIKLPLSKSGTFPIPKLPAIRIQPPKIQNITLTGARVVFPIQLTNPNPFPLPFTGFDAALSVAGTRVGAAAVRPPAALPSKQSQVIELPIDINFASSGMAVANVVRGGSAQVKLDGSLQSGAAKIPVELLQQLVFKR